MVATSSYYHNGLEARRAERNIGFIAQEVEPLFPALVYTSEHTRSGDNMKSFNYAGLSVVAIAALQELNQQMLAANAALEAKVKTLAEDNAAMSRRLESLEARLEAMETAQSRK